MRLLIAAMGLLAASVAAQTPPNENKAERIITQPVRDVGLSKRQIADVLQAARENPYSTTGLRRCGDIDREVQALNAVLGPDFDTAGRDKQDVAENLATAGAEGVINSFIPFRGLIREVTGAASQDRRYQAAVIAGSARRGFLKGIAQHRRCRLTPYVAPTESRQEEPPKQLEGKPDEKK